MKQKTLNKVEIDQLLNLYRIKYFYHITHIDNLESILSNGLISSNQLKSKLSFSENNNGLINIKESSQKLNKMYMGLGRDSNNFKGFNDFWDYPSEKRNSMFCTESVLFNEIRKETKNLSLYFKNHQNNNETNNINKLILDEYVPLYFNPECPILHTDIDLQENIVIICIDRNIISDDDVLFTNGKPGKDDTRFYKNLKDLCFLRWDEILKNHNIDKCIEGKSYLNPEVLVPNEINKNRIKKVICQTSATAKRVSEISMEYNRLDIKTNRRLYFMSGYSMDIKQVFNFDENNSSQIH